MRMREEMIVSKSMEKFRLVALSLCCGFFFLSTSFVSAQNCDTACAALQLGVSISDSEGCSVGFSSESAATPVVGFEPEIQWEWLVDGLNYDSGSSISVSAELAQSSLSLNLQGTLTAVGSGLLCTCSFDVDLNEALSDYNWPCACQPGGAPNANFDFTGLGECGGEFSFVNGSNGAGLGYAWVFGEAGALGTSSELNPTVSWSIPGGGVSQVPVTLTVTDENGCFDSSDEVIPVLETPDPWFQEAAPICEDVQIWPVEYNLINSNLNFFVDNELTKLTIDWGNGEVEVLTETTIPFATEYSEYGVYTISFTATGINGCETFVQDELLVAKNPTIETHSLDSESMLCAPAALIFAIEGVENNDLSTDYIINFGDGASASFNHPPPASVQHLYESTSCDAAANGEANVFEFTISASNGCSVAQTEIIPIGISEVVSPTIGGPLVLCAGLLGDFYVDGGFQDVSQPNCGEQVSSGIWEINALQGQALPAISAASGSEFQLSLDEPGLYQVIYEDYSSLQNTSPCAYEASDVLEICVIDAVEPEWSWESTSSCIPMEVQLNNTTIEPACGEMVYSWTVEGGDFEWSNGTGPNDENPQLTLLEALNYSVTLTVSAGADLGCSFASSQVVLSSEAAPQVFINSTIDSLCIGESWNGQVLINPGNSVLSGFGWTVDGIAVGPNSPAPLSYVMSDAGVHEVAVFAANACGVAEEQVTVFVAPEPVLEVVHPYWNCDFSEIEIIASGADYYQWSSTANEVPDSNPNDSAAVFFMNGNLAGSVLGSVNYDSFVCSSSSTYTVNAFWVPTIDITGDSVICEGEPVELSSVVNYFGNYSVEWMGPNNVYDGDTFAFPTDEGNTSPIDVMAVVTSAGLLCTDTATWTVQVEGYPIVEAGNPVDACNQSFDIVLDTATPAGGVWSGSAGVSPEGVFNPESLGLGTSYLEYSFENEFGCATVDTLIVSVNAPSVIDVGEDLSVCQSQETFYLGELGSPAGGVWSGLGVFGAASDSVDLSILSAGSHPFVYSIGEESCLVSDTLQIDILPSPSLWIDIIGGAVCNGDYVELIAEPVGGNSPDYLIEWSANMEVSDTDPFTAFIEITQPTNISAIATDTLGCSVFKSLTILPFPAPNVSMPASFSECFQNTEVILPSPFPSDGIWTGSGVVNNEDGVFNPFEAGLGTSFLSYSVFNSFGCEATDSVLVEVIAAEVIQAGADVMICESDQILQLEGFSPAGGLWSGPGVVDSVLGYMDVSGLPPSGYELIYSLGSGSCMVFDERVVQVNALPSIELASDTSFCPFMDVVQLSEATPSGGFWLGEGIVDSVLGAFDSNQASGIFDLAYSYVEPESGCADTVAYQVVLYDMPVAQFEAEGVSCQDAIWQAEDASLDATELTWYVDGLAQEGEGNEIVFPELGSFQVQLHAFNTFGCADSTSMNVEVVAPPIAQIAPANFSGCAPLDVVFSNESVASRASYLWEVNGSIYSDTIPPLQTFNEGMDVAVYSAFLTVSNACGASLDSAEIEVFPQPQMAFELLQDSACSPFTAEWTNTSVGNPVLLNWDFGNGQFGSGWNPVPPTYTVGEEPLAFDITLSGSNGCGADTVTSVIWVEPNTTIASFELSTEVGCAPLELTVTDLSVDATEMTFDFDNGALSSDSLATTTFQQAGNYEVTQYITNGCSYDTAIFVIEVLEAPDFEWVIESTEFCSDEIGVFGVESSNGAGIQWFVDGNEVGAGLELSQAWDSSGVHWVGVEVSAASMTCVQMDSVEVLVHSSPTLNIASAALEGCSPLFVEFENLSTGADGWSWDFADAGATSSVASPSHLFMNESLEVVYFDVVVTGESSEQCESSETIQVGVFPLPQIAFSTDGLSACGNPVEVQTFNETQGAVNFIWSLDGNAGSNMFAPAIEVEGFGSHSIELVASNLMGCEANMEQSFEVLENPTPLLALDPDMGCQPLMLYLNDQSIGAESAVIQIGLNGETVYEGEVPEEPIELTEAGKYSIQLEVVSTNGCAQTLDLPQAVDVWPVPEVSFLADPYAGTSEDPHPLNSSWNFLNETETGTAAYWDFGDGSNSFEWNASHEFGASGAYPVSLTVYNEYGCFNEVTQSVEIEEALQVFVPNAFTPPSGGYSDGVNDGWRPEVSDWSLLERYDLKVFNRWGQLVWRTQDPAEYWIGSVQNGGDHFAADDVYTWVLEIRSSALAGFSKVWQGNVSIFR